MTTSVHIKRGGGCGRQRRVGIMSALYGLLLTAVLSFMAACAGDDEAGDDGGSSREPVTTLALRIVPGTVGDLNTRANFSDTNAREGEFINTLCVFVVDAGGIIEKKIKPDLSGNEAAQKGNLEDYTSEEFEVTVGRKSFYAFANWGDNEDMAKVVNMSEGDKFDFATVSAVTLSDPASKINLTDTDPSNRCYIPMSGRVEEGDLYSLLNGGNTVDIPIDRLVSRLRLTLQANSSLGEDNDAKITSVTVGGFAENVTLFPDATLTGENYEEERTFTPTANGGFSAKAGPDVTFADVYVNETRSGSGFDVTMKVTQYGQNLTYTGRTSTKELPRNSIFPLNVMLSTLELEVKAEMIAPPIGVVMDSVEAEVEKGYNITIVEGATFTITPSMPGATNVTYNWITTGVDDTDWTIQTSTDGTLLSGTVTAVSGKEVSLQLNANWQTNGQTYSRTYNITITTKSLNDWTIPSSARWGTLSNAPAFWNK